MNNSKKKTIGIILGVCAFVAVISVTYAFITLTLNGSKKVTISAGVLDLVLEEENEITISDALPMYDEVGMIQENAFKFKLVNNSSNSTDYKLKLEKVSAINELSTSDVKYYLTKDDIGEAKLLSGLYDDNIIDSGTIAGNDTIDYSLRLWIRDGVTDNNAIAGKSLSYKLKVEGGQAGKFVKASVNWTVEDGYLETIQVGSNQYYVKISNEIVTEENSIGTTASVVLNDTLTNCGSMCVQEVVVTKELIDELFTYDEETGITSFNNILFYIPEEVTMGGLTASPGIWTIATSIDGTLVPTINTLIYSSKKTKIFTFAGVTKEAMSPTSKMFNYTNEGCVTELSTDKTTCSGILTNGIYVMNDDDGPSYFYRGEVNNLVKFGSYTKDYYVYRDSNHDFPSLEACKYYSSSCSESNKVLKYKASDNVPMYWRIVRVNGDGTIRMIYAGTTTDATGYDTGIGVSRYNEESNDPKYAGYTYDNTTTKTNSDAKTEIDNWYSNVLEGTTYDNKIATGKFCSNSSDYSEISTQNGTSFLFGSFKSFFAQLLGMGDTTPSFKCPTPTDANFGGNYNLKVGLITLDEAIAAGGQYDSNDSYYLYNGTKEKNDGIWFWTMTPGAFSKDEFSAYQLSMGAVYDNGTVFLYPAYYDDLLLRPVINLRADVVFKAGTDGSVTSPYELVD